MCCIELNSHIRHLSIVQRSRRRNKKKRIAYHARKVRLLRESIAVYTAKTKNSTSRLKDRVLVRDIEYGY